MIRYPRRHRLFAVGATILAGFVDATAFIQLGGFFVSFMSGNSTRLGVGTVYALPVALTAAGLITAFVLGVVLGSSLRRAPLAQSRALLMATIAALLALVASLALGGVLGIAGPLLAVAMGAVNAVLEEDGESRVGVTYMTGALVKMGQRITDGLYGGPRWGWLPWLGLWGGLVAGAVAGAGAFRLLGLNALWIAAVWAAGLALLVVEHAPVRHRSD